MLTPCHEQPWAFKHSTGKTRGCFYSEALTGNAVYLSQRLAPTATVHETCVYKTTQSFFDSGSVLNIARSNETRRSHRVMVRQRITGNRLHTFQLLLLRPAGVWKTTHAIRSVKSDCGYLWATSLLKQWGFVWLWVCSRIKLHILIFPVTKGVTGLTETSKTII